MGAEAAGMEMGVGWSLGVGEAREGGMGGWAEDGQRGDGEMRKHLHTHNNAGSS